RATSRSCSWGPGNYHPAGLSDALQRMPVESAPAALAAVRDGGADYACVPIENSIDGSVLPTLDSLAIGVRLQVFAETT
ncbi:prephenate dehydratase domain-containing protein, partial [Mycobacterium tuberculosis]|uniref:prephenate dehydratase domain-containing protein n=1 Tax=Mycobacterium tuberculosis TaxID=1773 RepID=UPI0023505EE3